MSIHSRLPTLSIPFHTASVTTGSMESPPAFDTAGSYVRLEILEQKTGTMLALTNPIWVRHPRGRTGEESFLFLLDTLPLYGLAPASRGQRQRS